MAEDGKRDNRVREDPFNMMMFGSRHENMENENETNQPSSNNIDFEELMVTIDQLVESARPYFQKIYPIIQRLWKKE